MVLHSNMIWILFYICLNCLVFLCEGFLWVRHKHNVSTTENPFVLNTTQPANLPGNDDIDPVKAEAGAIAGAVFGVLVSVCFIAFAGIMYLRRKRERDQEHIRKDKVLKESSRSAGVYMDTTLDFKLPQTSTTSSQGREYSPLHKDSNLYESDSEDELWSSRLR